MSASDGNLARVAIARFYFGGGGRVEGVTLEDSVSQLPIFLRAPRSLGMGIKHGHHCGTCWILGEFGDCNGSPVAGVLCGLYIYS